MPDQIVRGPLLIPNWDGSVSYHRHGVLAADENGVIEFAGPADLLRDTGLWPVIAAFDAEGSAKPDTANTGRRPVSQVRRSDGVMLPPFVDIHTHIPQHPIRGKFIDGVGDHEPDGKLIAGLNRNVFPAEGRCSSAECAERVVRQFLADTLSHGVVGGAAYMTVSAMATEIALSILPESWSVGLVLMDQNCPDYLRSDANHLDAEIEQLVQKFGKRLIVTDRFAVAVSTPLRKRGARLAQRWGCGRKRISTNRSQKSGWSKALCIKIMPAIPTST